MRKEISMNQGWLFAKTTEPPKTLPTDWEAVDLPHTWNAVDGQDGGNDYWRGTAMYCKAFPKPELEAGGKAFLEINGASNIADVYVNGTKLGHHEGGYSTFRLDITSSLAEENLLCISVDNGVNDYVYPQKADFTFYGGLYRNVNLITTGGAHFELEKDGTPGIRVTPCVNLVKKSADILVETWQQGGDAVVITVDQQSQEQEIADNHAETLFTLDQVHLWDGLNDPFLYTATARLYSGGVEVDCISTRFGCRSIEFNPERGFQLNGRTYPLRGVSRHQDRQGLGNAISIREHREDMDIIREMGANTIRLAHYQHAQEFYDLCDEYGMVVWAEIPYITEHMPNGRQNTLDQMRELITQCYNHPSIVCWGLSNEVAVHGVTEDLMENHVLLNDLCHAMDKTRPTTMAHAFMLEHDSPLIRIPDIGSYNLYFGWYLGNLEQNDSFFDDYHAKYPQRVMGFSEYGADANIRFQTAHPEQGDYSEQFQCKYHEYILECIDRHPWMWATHLWNTFDFAADGRDEGGAHGLNQKGIVSFDRKTKKDAFYLYKAAWNKTQPFVHLCGGRYVYRPEEITEVTVYSNCDAVSLYMDGKLLETKQGKRVFVFRVPITGAHTIEARSGELCDAIVIRKVDTPNLDYYMGNKIPVTNWFDEANFKTDSFSIRDSFGTLIAHPEAGKIAGSVMKALRAKRGEVAQSASNNANLQNMLAGMSFEAILKKAGDSLPPDGAKQINEKLQQIKK